MSKELNTLINTLSEDNFKKLVKEYLKARYKTTDVRIVDGPYDGGNDLEIIVNEKDIKKNIQITVQKQGFESKLNSDLKKARDNSDKYSYLKQLDFYISKNISKSKRNELEDDAEINHGITLKIIDGRTISEEAENYPVIRKIAYSSHNLKQEDEIIKTDKETKILFDVLTLNKDTVEIRKNLINSLVFSFLYTNPGANINQIFASIAPKLNNKLDKEYLQKEINYLKSKQQINSPKDNKKVFFLSDSKQQEIDGIFAEASRQEKELKEILISFIADRGLSTTPPELVSFLQNLYTENYNIDINEIKEKHSSYNSALKKSFLDIAKFFERKGLERAEAEEISKDLLNKVSQTDYLNKISAISLFTNLYSSDQLEAYITNKQIKLVLDTQILIRFVCVYYQEDYNFDDIALRSVQTLYRAIQKYADQVQVITTSDYVEEVAGHFVEALNLQRFMALPFVKDLGRSRNVFYNMYQELDSKGDLEEGTDFLTFMETFVDFEIINNSSNSLRNSAWQSFAEIFEIAGIELISHPLYDKFQSVKKEYEISLAFNKKHRSYSARENDLRTIFYLSNLEKHTNYENGQVNEPFFVTWDSAFYSTRKDLLAKNKEFGYWYIYSPLKVVDRLFVRNFSFNPSSININVISLAEYNFNYSSKGGAFFDVISSLFNEKDVSKLNILKKLASLKKSTHSMDEEKNEDFSDKGVPVTEILLNVRNHFYNYENEHSFQDLIQLFENPNFEDEIVSVLKKAMKTYSETEGEKKYLFEFDNLVKKSKNPNISLEKENGGI